MFSSVDKKLLHEAYDKFNSCEWYKAHDLFEEIWMELDGDERQIIQGLLQISVSQYHMQNGNINGALILLGEGLGRLNKRINLETGFNINMLCKSSQSLLIELQNGEGLEQYKAPKIVIID